MTRKGTVLESAWPKLFVLVLVVVLEFQLNKPTTRTIIPSITASPVFNHTPHSTSLKLLDASALSARYNFSSLFVESF